MPCLLFMFAIRGLKASVSPDQGAATSRAVAARRISSAGLPMSCLKKTTSRGERLQPLRSAPTIKALTLGISRAWHWPEEVN